MSEEKQHGRGHSLSSSSGFIQPVSAPAAARSSLNSAMHKMHRLSTDVGPQFSYGSTGVINWKTLWNALLSGQHASIRKWVADLPLKGAKVDSNGRLDVGQSVMPASFILQLEDMLAKATPGLNELVVDSLCWRGVFLPRELNDFNQLAIRLARNGLLFRPAGRRELKPLSLERFLPFGSVSAFHRFILGRTAHVDVFQYAPLRKTYIAWYKLGDFVAGIEEAENAEVAARMRKLALKTLPKFLQHDAGGKSSSSGSGGYGGGSGASSGFSLSDHATLDSMLGNFVAGCGYIIGFDPLTGEALFGSEDEGLAAMRAEQERADAQLKASIDAEIDAIQLRVAAALVIPNFEPQWLKILAIPTMRVHPQHIDGDRISHALNEEIESILPRRGSATGGLLSNTPQDQILVLILFLLYKFSAPRAMRIAAPLLRSNPTIMYRLLSMLVCKVAISNIGQHTKAQKRLQAHSLHFLKMVQQYAQAVPDAAVSEAARRARREKRQANRAAEGKQEGEEEDHRREPEDEEDQADVLDDPAGKLAASLKSLSDAGATVHGLPMSQNYPLMLSMMLDVAALLQRYIPNLNDVLNHPALSALLPPPGSHPLLSRPEREHLPALLWAVWIAVARRRNSRVPAFASRAPDPELGEEDVEGPLDTAMIAWFLAMLHRLYMTVAGLKKTPQVGAVPHRPAIDSATLAYLTLGWHMICHEPFPQGFGRSLRAEQVDAGPLAVFTQTFLWFGGLAQEDPLQLTRRILTLHEEGFFAGEMEGYFAEADDGSGKARRTLNGTVCLEHLCLVLAPYSAILMASKPSENAEARAEALALAHPAASAAAKQAAAAVAAARAPVWDATSETLLRVAFDPFTRNVLALSSAAKASYLLSRAGTEEVTLTLAAGIGASSADSLLGWLRRQHPRLLAGIPELPVPGPRAPEFIDRSTPLEKALLRLAQAGTWYTLENGFTLFAPGCILHSATRFLKSFTQRRYKSCHVHLSQAFEDLAATRNLGQGFSKRHFFAVGSSAQDAAYRNAQAYSWTLRMIVALLRAGLLIGMQGNIPSSHRMANIVEERVVLGKGGAPLGAGIDLTDYDRNFLMDLFGGMLQKYGRVGGGGTGTEGGHEGATHTGSSHEHDESTAGPPVFTQSMLNEILSVVPPTVSSSFLLNITRIAHNSLLVPGVRSQIHRLRYREHKYSVWKNRLQGWREHEAFYSRVLADLVALLDLERMVGISLLERDRFIRHLYREIGEVELAESLRGALWYQLCLYLYKQPHSKPLSLCPKLSNASDPLAPTPPGVTQSGSETHSQNNVEHSSEKSEALQEIILMWLALQSWQKCHDTLTSHLDEFFRRHPNLKPKLAKIDLGGGVSVDGAAASSAATSATSTLGLGELMPALGLDGRPLPLPEDIVSKQSEASALLFVIHRIRGRIYWLMLLHGLNNLRDSKGSRIEFDLNEVAERAEWEARRVERRDAKAEKEMHRMIKRAEREARRIARESDRDAAIAAGSLSAAVELPPTPPEENSDDEHEADEEDAEEEEDDVLFPLLVIDFAVVQNLHLGSHAHAAPKPGQTAAAAQNAGGGISCGLEKFHQLGPGQFLPWNGNPLQNPASAVLAAQAKHRAVTFAFDEDMDITRLAAAEVRLIGEYTVDTTLLLAVVECLVHTRMFRTSLRVAADVVERFPLLRFTPRMQAVLYFIDVVQLLFFIAHPSLQDVRINQVLSGQSGAPFSGPNSTTLTLPEHMDPYAVAYKELLDWPIVRHVLREEEQTWLRMRWYAGGASGGGHSNQTLILQRILVETPSIYQNIFLSLILAEGNANVTTVYSRTRPVGVEIVSAEAAAAAAAAAAESEKPSSLMGGMASSLMGGMASMATSMKNIGDAIKGERSASSALPGVGSGESLDVEHVRQWLLTLDEAGRVELLDRFVQMSLNPSAAPLTAAKNIALASGVAAAAADASKQSHPSTVLPSLHAESFNAHFAALTRRHLPLLCEIAQALAISVRVARVELIKPRNKKLAPLPPGLRVSSQQFLVTLASILVKTRPCSVRLPMAVPMHYADPRRPDPDRNAPSTAWVLTLAERLDLPVLQLLNMHPAQILHHLWTNNHHRAEITTLLASGQIYYHFMNHHNFSSLDRELHGSDVCAAMVEALVKIFAAVDSAAGPPSPFVSFLRTAGWWGREEMAAYVGVADRSEQLALPTLAAAFRAQAYVLIKARDPSAAVSSNVVVASAASASSSSSSGNAFGSRTTAGGDDLEASTAAAGLLGWWQGPKDASRPFLHGHGLGEFLRLSPGTCMEFELLYASYFAYLAAGRSQEMRQVAADLRSGFEKLWARCAIKSKHPAPPIITSPTNPEESIAPPFAGASLEQVEALYLARLQLERASLLLCHDTEMREVVAGVWRQFRKKAPAAFA